MSIRIAVCDDMKQMRDYFADIIESQEDMELVGTAGSENEIVDLVCKEKPDIALIDIQMEKETSGIDATKRIKDLAPETKVIAITIHEEDDYIIQMYLMGVADYILKAEYTKEEICESIRNTYQNKVAMRPRIAQTILSEFSNMHIRNVSLLYFVNVLTALTQTEMEILRDLYFGKSRTDIAKSRYVEVETVKFHIHNILKKLNYKKIKVLISDLKTISFFENLYKK